MDSEGAWWLTHGLEVAGDFRNAVPKVCSVGIQQQRQLHSCARQMLLQQLLVLRVNLRSTPLAWRLHHLMHVGSRHMLHVTSRTLVCV